MLLSRVSQLDVSDDLLGKIRLVFNPQDEAIDILFGDEAVPEKWFEIFPARVFPATSEPSVFSVFVTKADFINRYFIKGREDCAVKCSRRVSCEDCDLIIDVSRGKALDGVPHMEFSFREPAALDPETNLWTNFLSCRLAVL